MSKLWRAGAAFFVAFTVLLTDRLALGGDEGRCRPNRRIQGAGARRFVSCSTSATR